MLLMNPSFQLYHSTFLLSTQSLNYNHEIFSLMELKQEFQDRILFGFLEGIWCLDIIYQGQRPVADTLEGDDGLNIDDEYDKIKTNTADQDSYKREFFAMLEDVIELSSESPSILLDPESHFGAKLPQQTFTTWTKFNNQHDLDIW